MLLRYLVWLAVPLLALVELGAYEVHAHRVPQPDEWKRVLPAAVARGCRAAAAVVGSPGTGPSDRVHPMKS